VSYPTGTVITDEFFGDSEVYFKHANVLIGAGEATVLDLSWQGCAKAGLCYPPQSVSVNFSGQQVPAPDIRAEKASTTANNELWLTTSHWPANLRTAGFCGTWQ
jgi:thiol:disulfide interchange protein DsbD